jgi:hypothetical protein
MQDPAYSVLLAGWPPPPRYTGISDLEEKSNLIYGAQSVTGKILMSKNLAPERRAVLAAAQRSGSDHHGGILDRAQGQMSHDGAVNCGKATLRTGARRVLKLLKDSEVDVAGERATGGGDYDLARGSAARDDGGHVGIGLHMVSHG